jgi:hypothetical protein
MQSQSNALWPERSLKNAPAEKRGSIGRQRLDAGGFVILAAQLQGNVFRQIRASPRTAREDHLKRALLNSPASRLTAPTFQSGRPRWGGGIGMRGSCPIGAPS